MCDATAGGETPGQDNPLEAILDAGIGGVVPAELALEALGKIDENSRAAVIFFDIVRGCAVSGRLREPDNGIWENVLTNAQEGLQNAVDRGRLK